MTATEKPKLTRRALLALITVGVLALAGLCVVVANVTSSPEPVPYQVTATGNVRATWYSDSSVGNFDLTTGYDVQTVTAHTLSVSVDSTLPGGAYCRIEGPNGETYVDRARANGDKVVTATCATK